ncbi:hypothetical protein CKA32_001602 [Geitlerinema sp. FC II]|nr:hypothetical protein [Geitlerinema sp. CS-897]PPT10341.1 hypothetical protein CKA32_001602 [Geitlerinema sp. FC II]
MSEHRPTKSYQEIYGSPQVRERGAYTIESGTTLDRTLVRVKCDRPKLPKPILRTVN